MCEDILNICSGRLLGFRCYPQLRFSSTDHIMPESMFGRPSQHLLPSHPPAGNAKGSSLVPDPPAAPVPPLDFKDFRFNSIGKQPELLSRISFPQPEQTDYHSPTPSPTSTPFLSFTNDALPSQSSSRPTLFQQLAGADSSTMDVGSRWYASTSQSNPSLASRIQMDVSPSNNISNAAHDTTTGFSSFPLRVDTFRRANADANLIPPVEVLPQPPNSSSPPTPTSLAPTLEPVPEDSPTSSALLPNTATTRTSQIPTPIATTNATSWDPVESSSALAAVDTMIRNLEPSSSTVPIINSLVARQERLQVISANLADLALPLPRPPSRSSSPDPSFIARANDNATPHQSNQLQYSTTPVILHRPYSANQSSSPVYPSISDMLTSTDGSSLAPIPSPTTLAQDYQTQCGAFIEAVQSVNSALNALHRIQVDSENTFAHQLRALEEQRAVFEQRKRVEAATLQQESQELQQKREELNAKESHLTLLEKETKAREDARKGMLARRQAEEEERRAAEAKRIQETQERIATAVKEVMEVEALALRAKSRFEQLPNEAVADNLPTEPQEGMSEEEIAAMKSRNDLLRDVKHLRKLHMDKVQKLEESDRVLRRLEEERKKRRAEEAERRRIAEEERLRAHAEAERARQVQDEQRRQFEAERKRQAENDRELRLPAEKIHAEAQAHGLRRTDTTSNQRLEHRNRAEEIVGSQPEATADSTRIRMVREANTLSPATNAMSVDSNERASVSRRTVPLPDIHTSSRNSRGTTAPSIQKKDKPISGGVILAAPVPKARGIHLPSKPLANPPSLSSSDRVAENTVNLSKTPPAISTSPEGRHRSAFPAQLASEFNRVSDGDIRSTPDHRPPFPRTPKSQVVLDAISGGNQELNIGPVPGVSPTQRNVNLRHLKRSRGHVEENGSGDRSVRTVNVKSEENSCPPLKREEDDSQTLPPVPASLSAGPPASLPPRPVVIPPPRPWMDKKRRAAPLSQTDSTSSYPPKSSELSSTRETKVATPPGAASRGSPIAQATDTPVQLPPPAGGTNSLLLAPARSETQTTESRINTSERSTQDRTENYNITSSEFATLSHEMDGEDPSRNNRRFTEEHRKARNENGSRHIPDRYSPPLAAPRSTAASPTQAHRPIDTWRPQTNPHGPRAEPMRATSPTIGRKRPSEFGDNEHGHRARRHRLDGAWITQDHDRGRVDAYRPHRDRRHDSELDERRPAYRAPSPPPDRSRHYSLPRAAYDNRTYVPPSEESTAQPVRREQPHRRPENDDTYHRYQPSSAGHNAAADQYHTDDARFGQTYESVTEERMNVQPDPPLLARMSTTQRAPVTIAWQD